MISDKSLINSEDLAFADYSVIMALLPRTSKIE
jgi:hypothetical protein